MVPISRQVIATCLKGEAYVNGKGKRGMSKTSTTEKQTPLLSQMGNSSEQLKKETNCEAIEMTCMDPPTPRSDQVPDILPVPIANSNSIAFCDASTSVGGTNDVRPLKSTFKKSFKQTFKKSILKRTRTEQTADEEDEEVDVKLDEETKQVDLC